MGRRLSTPRRQVTNGAEHTSGVPRRVARRMPWVLAVVLLVLLVTTRIWVIEPFRVASQSMLPAVAPGSYALLLIVPGTANSLHAGDLVVFESPADSSLVLKRVIAFGGQRVAIRDAVLEIDGVGVAEPELDLEAIDGTYFGPVDIPAQTIFVLGDNRGTSIDSRNYGPVPLAKIRGKVLWFTKPPSIDVLQGGSNRCRSGVSSRNDDRCPSPAVAP